MATYPKAQLAINTTTLPIRPGRNIHIKQWNNTVSEDAAGPATQHASRRASLRTFFNPLGGTLLFVHGSCASVDQFESLINELGPFLKKKNFMAEGFDAYGCGQSDKKKVKEAYAEEELQEDLKAVFSKAKHPTTNFIIGHSYGTSQVIKLYNSLSSEEQRCVKGIVLLSGSLPGTNGGHPIFILPSMILDLLQGWMSSNFRKAAFHPKASEELLALAEARSNQNPMYMCKYFYEQTKWATFEEVKAVNCKALIVHGDSDRILNIEAGRRLHSAMGAKASFKVMEEVSHQVMEEDPVKLAEILVEFMTECLK